MKAKYLFVALFVVGAFYIGQNFDKFEAIFSKSNEVKSSSLPDGYSIEAVKKDAESLEDKLSSNLGSPLRAKHASDDQITADEALDLIEEMFSVNGVTVDSARFIDHDEHKYLLSVRAHPNNATTIIDNWWTVDRISGEIKKYDSDVLAEE